MSDAQRKLESESLMLFELYRDNYLKVNSGKFHVMLITYNKLKIKIKGSLISNEKIVKLLGVAIDNKLNKPHLSLVCEKFSQKVLNFKVYFKEKAKSYLDGIYNVAVQFLSFVMDVP